MYPTNRDFQLIPFYAYDTLSTPEPWFRDLVLDVSLATSMTGGHLPLPLSA